METKNESRLSKKLKDEIWCRLADKFTPDRFISPDLANLSLWLNEKISDYKVDTSATEGNLSFWDNQKNTRFTTKIGRFLVKRLSLGQWFNGSEIEQLGNKIKCYAMDFKFELVSGEDIAIAYEESFGSSSCMTGTREYVGLYSDNPEYRMLKATCGRMQGRAMVVPLQGNRFLMDRIYCNADIVYNEMIEFGKKQGFIVHDYKNKRFYPPVEATDLKTIPLTYTNGCVPYQDTLTGGIIVDNGVLVLTAGDNYDVSTNITDGYIQTVEVCECCGEHLTCDDDVFAVSGTVYCAGCYDERVDCCDYCGEDCPKQEGAYSGVTNTFFCHECFSDAERCQYCGGLYHIDDLEYDEKRDIWCCDSCQPEHKRAIRESEGA